MPRAVKPRVRAAAAMSVLIIAVGLTVRLGYWILMRGVTRRTQGWIQGGAPR